MALTMAAVAGGAVPTPPSAPPPAPEALTPSNPPPSPTASFDQDFIKQVAGMNARQIGMDQLAHGKAAARQLRLRSKIEHIELQNRLALVAKYLKLDVARRTGRRASP